MEWQTTCLTRGKTLSMKMGYELCKCVIICALSGSALQVLSNKLENLKIESTPSQAVVSGAIVDNNVDVNWPSIAASNDINRADAAVKGDNVIKILKRPSTGNTTETSNTGPQITLENNTRSQYVPQVRILKRPNAKHNSSHDNSLIDSKSSAVKSQTNNKTYEEREAEYAKARLRILGSASATEECNNEKTDNNDATLNSTKLQLTNNSNEVPVIRLPIGPNGSKGFAFQR